MKPLYPLFGIVSVLNTPFIADNTIDFQALKTNVGEAIKAGVTGFLVPAMASEVYKLSANERLNMVSAVLEEVNGRLNVSGGWAVTHMIVGLTRNVHAFMPTGMHWVYSEIYRFWKEGKIAEATSLFQKILPVLAFSNQHLDISIHFFKRLLHRQGLYPTDRVRDPILQFDRLHQQIADQLIERVIEIENGIKFRSQTVEMHSCASLQLCVSTQKTRS